MRVKKFTNRGSTTKVIGKFPSLKTGKTVWWESQIERDFIYLAEFDTDVLTYREQPLRINYTLNGKRHIFTPDFLVERNGERQVVEVKPEEEASKPENIALFRVLIPIVREEGYRFVVVTDRVIRKRPRLDNIKFLWRYSRVPLDPQHFIYCRELMLRRENVRLADAFAFFESKGATRATVYGLLYRGALEVDLMQPMSADVLVSLPSVAPRTCTKAS